MECQPIVKKGMGKQKTFPPPRILVIGRRGRGKREREREREREARKCERKA
jgi:hypothetical protein